MTPRLSARALLPKTIAPAYRPEDHGIGIVHIGLGAFHKAHQAAYTDTALAVSGGDWRILGVSLRSTQALEQLGPQDGRYTLIEHSAAGSRARVIGAIAGAVCAANGSDRALAAMADPTCRIVSLTVTEKAYGLDRTNTGCDPTHPAVKADLATPEHPQGVLGLIARAAALRRQAGLAPFTVLCCDNLPENGLLLRGAVIDFAWRIDPDLAEYMARELVFPCCMVDRITPAATAATRAEAARQTGYADAAATDTEDFRQWVIEDNFPQGRPDWASARALFVTDVAPYESMKLRMLNGSHSMLAYAGFHAGLALVRDVMAHRDLAALVSRHMQAAAATLPPLSGIDLDNYASQLCERFANPAIAHETFQIAMDGTEKMPQRIFSPADDARKRGADLRPFAFATAAWMRHASRAAHDCPPYELRDPRASDIGRALANAATAIDIAHALSSLPGLMPDGLCRDTLFLNRVTEILERMLSSSMIAAIQAEGEQ
ncbi:mannitol dehydrogenase family protein [Natronohydrobacter thiooxidans]|uniref:mannitol dehydrogenase family protein n=1 Tax=Natronohydrobacter thiooxidans TaxID=87172 RepID=UPI0008FF42F6|nr:mannitol dehydrogenase family protein [Natronohydrobacter thiooxidans]